MTDFLIFIFDYHILEILCIISGVLILFLCFSLIPPQRLVQMGWPGRLTALLIYGKNRKHYKRNQEP